MTLDDIQNLWQEDCIIDPDNLHLESIKVPSLHSKYYNIYNNIFLLKKMEDDKFKQVRFNKWQYYTGKVPADDATAERCDHKVMKQDVDKYLDSDADLRKLIAKIDYYQTILTYLDSILKTIKDRTYQIKNAIEFQKFTHGYS